MLVSLNKNKWLYDWMTDLWQEDLQRLIFNEEFDIPRPKQLRVKLALLLESKGFKTKITSKFDVIIVMTEEDYFFLKLKYD